MGATSAYIINVMMSAVYITLLQTHPERKFSLVIGWTKGLGTACFSLFMFMEPLRRYGDEALADKGFLLTLCVVTLVLDVVYVVMLHRAADGRR
jgi:Co/Zn/Cd efflux system component